MRIAMTLLVLVAIGACRREPPPVTSPRRALAVRLSWAPLDRWRPLDEGAGGREPIALAARSRLDERGDLHGVAALSLAAGDRNLADAALARAPHTPDVDADRAAARLVAGDVDAALEQLDAVLASSPRQPRALWNRGLALAQLDLPLAAAQSFEAVAALGEPGWADEARARAQALTASWNARVATGRAAVDAARAMVAGAPPVDAAQAQRWPSLTRHYFYHAVRAAPSRRRLDELRPLARALDASFGGEVLQRFVDRVAKEPPAIRAALGPRFGHDMLLPDPPTDVSPAEAAQLCAAIDAAHADDLRLATLLLLDRHGPDDLKELARLVARDGDPWWRAWLAERQSEGMVEHDQLDRAARTLEDAAAECDAHHFDFRCASLQKQLALVDVERHRLSDARHAALTAIKHGRDAGMVPQYLETSTIFLLAEIARYRNDFSLMRAYLAEGILRVPNNCDAQRHARLMLGIERIFELDFDGAARELAATPACQQSFPLLEADLVGSLFLAGHDTPQAKTLPADLARVRPSLTPYEQLIADAMEARLSLARDHAHAAALLAPAMRVPRTVPDADAKKARTFAYQMLAVDAGRRGAWGEALDLLAEEAGAATGERCALGVALDDARGVVAARASDGTTAGHYDAGRARAEVDASALVPPSVRAVLARCETVDVYALAPVHGQPELLPPELAWRYRMGRAAMPLPPPSPSPRRLVISDVVPPASLRLPPLFPWRNDAAHAAWLGGPSATPSRVLAASADADEIVFNAHGLIDLDLSDTWMLALSPDADGKFALTAAEIERRPLAAHPLVVLGACYAGRIAPYLHEPWSLPMAFLDAGARAVFASTETVPDGGAAAFFDAILARVRSGQSPSVALRDERLAWLRGGHGSWTRHVVLFE